MRTDRLIPKVAAVNKANAYALELYKKLVPIFEPLVGSMIEKKDGSLLAKVEKLLPEFKFTPQLHVYKHRSDYSLAWCVKTCEVVAGCATYHEVTVYIGDMSNGVLTKITPPAERRTDYTVEEIVKKREAYEKAKKIADDAKGELFPFGEYDN